jgi:hypothetical protein
MASQRQTIRPLTTPSRTTEERAITEDWKGSPAAIKIDPLLEAVPALEYNITSHSMAAAVWQIFVQDKPNTGLAVSAGPFHKSGQSSPSACG